MNHTERAYSFCRIDDEMELLDAISNYKWPLCFGFYHGNALYLCDAESEDKPEYSIVKIDKTEGRFEIFGREIGKIKPHDMNISDLHFFIHDIAHGNHSFENPVRIKVEPKWHHKCHNCSLEDAM